ncbi:MAG: transglycosylase SLT domain-containing protein [Gammaproteobacteria bacterium]
MIASSAAQPACRSGFDFARVLFVLAVMSMAGCGNGDAPASEAGGGADGVTVLRDAGLPPYTGDLDTLRDKGVIRALVTYSRTDFFIDDGRMRGIQAEFLRAFEQQLNEGVTDPAKQVRVQFLPVTFDRMIPAVAEGLGDIGAHFLTVTADRQEHVDFATGKRMRVDEIVVTHKDVSDVVRLEDLSGREVVVLRGSSYATHLRAVNEDFRSRGLAPIRVVEADARLLSEDLLELVNAGALDVTVIDDYRGRLWAKVLPDIRLREDIKVAEGNPVGWVLRKDSPRLQAALDRFVDQGGKGTLLGNMLFKRYFENTRWITDPNRAEEQDRLNRFIGLFRTYGERYGFDPLALAAQAYQESGLKHETLSHRGAVGLMQLLPSTASDPNVGMEDISTPERNVHAAAKYMAFLRDRYFSGDDIAKQDRLAFSWAAYNAGPAKVRRMRAMAAEMGLDPNRWFGHVEVAAARIVGRETVQYVRNIKKYHLAYRLARQVDAEKKEARDQAL